MCVYIIVPNYHEYHAVLDVWKSYLLILLTTFVNKQNNVNIIEKDFFRKGDYIENCFIYTSLFIFFNKASFKATWNLYKFWGGRILCINLRNICQKKVNDFLIIWQAVKLTYGRHTVNGEETHVDTILRFDNIQSI